MDDLLYDYSDSHGWDLQDETLDKIINDVKTVALRRFE
jgi:type I restriction enzyme R subunit